MLISCFYPMDLAKLYYHHIFNKNLSYIVLVILLAAEPIAFLVAQCDFNGSTNELIDMVLSNLKIISDSEYEIEQSFKQDMRNKVERLCYKFDMC